MNKSKAAIVLLSLLLVLSIVLSGCADQAYAVSEAEYGGFLYPFRDDPNDPNDDKRLAQNAHDGLALDFMTVDGGSTGLEFDVLAPKDGVVIDFEDRFPVTQGVSGCPDSTNFPNYVVLGHGDNGNGSYQTYTLYYHLAQGSVSESGISIEMFVHLGQKIGRAGKTGHSNGPDPINHLHFSMSKGEPVASTPRDLNCAGVNLTDTHYRIMRPDAPFNVPSIQIGFEEVGNQWPLLNGGTGNLNSPHSFNWTGIANSIDLQDKPNIRYCQAGDDVRLYNHVDYGGECVSIIDTNQTANVPDDLHISSIYINPDWSSDYLSFYSEPNQGGFFGVTFGNIDNLVEYRDGWWNDKIKSLHNHYTGNSWLTEFSVADNPPLETDIHVVVQQQADLDAWRVCFNGENCQENASGITELYYTWPTYLEDEGTYAITVEYRRDSHNQNWANAEVMEFAYYLNHFGPYSACDGGTGATLQSGSECIRVTGDVSDLGFAGWGDRSDLNVTANGYDVLAYIGCCFDGPPYLVKDGQTKNLGGNISSIELRDPLNGAYVPDSPLGVDANTTSYMQLNGDAVDVVGGLSGNLTGDAAYVTGRFGQAVNASGNGSVNFGTVNLGSPFSIELFVKMNANVVYDQRIATQIGGGPNTGYNKWLIGVVNNRFRTWMCYTNGCHEAYSLEPIVPDRWYYIMLSYDGGTSYSFYLDSVLQHTLDMDGTISPGNTTFELAQGEGIYGCNCVIDDVRISDIYRVPVGPPPDPTPVPTSTFTPQPTPQPTATQTPPPPQGNGVELLTSGAWYLTGNNGSSEAYQNIDPNVLQGKDMLSVTLNLHGLSPLCGDASALIFDQNGWQYVSLCNYVQAGLDGEQTVEIPLSDFTGLNLSQAVGILHVRFWYGSSFTVDITSIVAYDSGTSQPTPTPTPLPANGCGGAVTLDGVVLFSEGNCGGTYVQLLVPGSLYDLSAFGFNDIASSVSVKNNMSIKVFKDSNLNGESRCLSWDYWNLYSDTWPDGSGMNDTISSIEVFDNTSCQASSPTPTPGPGSISLFEHSDYNGNVRTFNSAGLYNLTDFNDAASSSTIATGWSVMLYEHNDKGGDSLCMTADNANFNDGDTFSGGTPLNDRVSSIEVFNDATCGGSGTDTVIIYESSGYSYNQYGWNSPGLYNLPGSMNDRASSIRITSGWSVLLYEHGSQGGASICLNADDDNFQGDTYSNSTTGLNDSVSSVQIFDNPTCIPQPTQTPSPSPNGLPTPWQNQDVGSVGQIGIAAYSGGTFTIEGSGVDIWNSSDGFHYVYQTLDGAGEIIARVDSLENTNEWAKAGPMIRETLEADSKHAFMAITPSNGTSFQRRISTGGTSYGTSGDGISAPYWLRLVRNGDTFTGYKSSDGVSWIQVGSVTISMQNNVYIGLAVTSHFNSTLATATFRNVTVNSSVLPTNTPTPTPAVTPTSSPDSALYNFEDGSVQGWGYSDSVTNVSNSTAQAYAGNHSMCADVNLSGNGWSYGIVSIDNQDVVPGDTITAHFFVSLGYQGVSATVYLQDYIWGWYESSWVILTPGQWNTITLDLAGVNFTMPSKRIGFQIGGNDAYQGCVYIDNIELEP